MENHSTDSHRFHEHLVELRLVGRWPVASDENTVATGHPFPLSLGGVPGARCLRVRATDTFVVPKDFITVWVGRSTIGWKSV